MTDSEVLEQIYREYLEEDIIFCLAERRKLEYEDAIDAYYTSRLADMIHRGEYGIQYLDYHVLTDILEDELNQK